MNGLSGITFAYPEALLLLLLIPMYLYWYLRIYRRERLVIRLSYDPERIQPGNKAMTYLRMLPRGMQLFALGLLILALSRPQAEQKLVDPVANGLDIMLLIDVSASMEARDISPNRLEAAKETAASFVTGRKYDQIGLVLFAEEALSYAPLTLDYEFLKQLIRSIQPRFFSGQSTAIGTAVSAAINRMRDSNSPGRVIVLLTDGANNAGDIDPVSAAKLAAEHRIRIYTVGMGRNSYFDPVSGQTLSTEFDEAGLSLMAQITGGAFFRAEDSRSLQQVFEEISRLETRQVKQNAYLIVKDYYPLFIRISMILLALSFLTMLTFIYNPLEQ